MNTTMPARPRRRFNTPVEMLEGHRLFAAYTLTEPLPGLAAVRRV